MTHSIVMHVPISKLQITSINLSATTNLLFEAMSCYNRLCQTCLTLSPLLRCYFQSELFEIVIILDIRIHRFSNDL